VESKHQELKRYLEERIDILKKAEEIFSALGNMNRMKILYLLMNEPMCVSGISSVLELSQPLVSQQLRILRHLNLVKGVRDGRKIVYSIADRHIVEAMKNIQEYLEEKSS